MDGILGKMSWKLIPCLRSELRLDIVLKCGQSFRWKSFNEQPDQWIGVLDSRVWLLSQDHDHLKYKTFPKAEDSLALDSFLTDYFQLKVKLEPLYKAWAKEDPVFEKISSKFSGVRMLRQHPVENLFSFICSSNNNIQRISGMVENLCIHFGTEIWNNEDTSYFTFPSVEQLAQKPTQVEKKLRDLGFGYRAAYIAKSARQIADKGGEEYLMKLRTLPYIEARDELLKLTGIGPKVADCVLLMSLDQTAAIPVDTHMFQIAATKYLPHLKGYKSVTDKVYKEIGDHFRSLYGDYSGWAHSSPFRYYSARI
ncbi:N-glycosylase/DNA lyase-like isoform X2 [Tigriopus californicus]|uniref:N-glycosylase/DNA lyase-like isoform X2 n=1 Tax=Tigriopus californicus TaxID=6832 RepID=UPI0027D9E404|nr:N-glycosylase/DNA lyase-like isoform X2 [Tigriopus californicus]